MRSSARAGVSHCEANIIRGSRCGLETLFFDFLHEQHIEIITERETGMDEDMLNTIEEKVQEAVREAIEEKMDDFSDSIAEELDGRLQDIIEEAVNDSIIEFFSEGIEEFLSSHQLALKDGTILQMKQKMRAMTPDKKRVLICYGGMRVVGTSLQIQTRISCWETFWNYETEEQAIEALQKMSAAIDRGLSMIEM